MAKIYEYVNLLSSLKSKKSIHEEEIPLIIKNLTIIIHPFIPHISEELWKEVGDGGLCATTNWPNTREKFEKKLFKMPIQINGKTRSLISVNIDEEKDAILNKVMSDDKIMKNIKNKKLVKTIYVKDKIVNLVIK